MKSTETLSHKPTVKTSSDMQNPPDHSRTRRYHDIDSVYVKIDGEYIPVEPSGDSVSMCTFIEDGQYSALHLDVTVKCDQCEDASYGDDYPWISAHRDHYVTVGESWYVAGNHHSAEEQR